MDNAPDLYEDEYHDSNDVLTLNHFEDFNSDPFEDFDSDPFEDFDSDPFEDFDPNYFADPNPSPSHFPATNQWPYGTYHKFRYPCVTLGFELQFGAFPADPKLNVPVLPYIACKLLNAFSTIEDTPLISGERVWFRTQRIRITTPNPTRDISTMCYQDVSQPEPHEKLGRQLLVEYKPSLSNSKYIREVGVEIKSPIMRVGSYKRIVNTVWDVLDSIYHVVKVRTYFNTGLHIHVGLRGGYKLAQLKRVAKAVVVWEFEMDRFHQPSRHACKFSILSNCRKARQLVLAGSVENMVELIDEAEDEIDVVEIMNGSSMARDHDYKYNFWALFKFGTIEFRQAQATMDVDGVKIWIRRVLAFVNAAIRTSHMEFAAVASIVDGFIEIDRKDKSEIVDAATKLGNVWMAFMERGGLDSDDLEIEFPEDWSGSDCEEEDRMAD
ncbi:hypothetical protein RUND412_004281 [Rhizina undulata]